MTRPVALKSSDITMANRVAWQLWPVDTQPKARRMVKVARIFSTVGEQVRVSPQTLPLPPHTGLRSPLVSTPGQARSRPQAPVHFLVPPSSALNHAYSTAVQALCCKQCAGRARLSQPGRDMGPGWGLGALESLGG